MDIPLLLYFFISLIDSALATKSTTSLLLIFDGTIVDFTFEYFSETLLHQRHNMISLLIRFQEHTCTNSARMEMHFVYVLKSIVVVVCKQNLMNSFRPGHRLWTCASCQQILPICILCYSAK